jgi:hypothetical protein
MPLSWQGRRWQPRQRVALSLGQVRHRGLIPPLVGGVLVIAALGGGMR